MSLEEQVNLLILYEFEYQFYILFETQILHD